MKDIIDTLTTKRLILRPYQSKDAKDCEEFLLDHNTTLDDGNYLVSKEELPAIFKFFEETKDRYMIELASESKVIGTIHIMDSDKRNVLSIGYCLSPYYRRQGYAYEAVKKAIEHTFYSNSCIAIIAEAYDYNQASLGLIHKLAFDEEDRTPIRHQKGDCNSICHILYNSNECFDIVDENGEPTGEVVSRKYAHDYGIPHRTSHCWILRKKQEQLEILVQKRVETKDSFPGAYDISSAGHIPCGMGYEESAIRELQEELGLSIPLEDLQFVGRIVNNYERVFHGKPFRDHEVTNVYILFVENPTFHLQEEEVSEVKWYEFHELYHHVRENTIDHCIRIQELDFIKKKLQL